jgi:hypothetical protein
MHDGRPCLRRDDNADRHRVIRVCGQSDFIMISRVTAGLDPAIHPSSHKRMGYRVMPGDDRFYRYAR